MSARRFLTVEDLRRAQGGEVVVDAQTIVTPQAQEAARVAGIAIRTASGAWKEPAPDRGPDAARAQGALPHLPEPFDETSGTSVVVTAVGKNRPGVLAEITVAIAELGANVQDVSQKMIDQYFHMVLIVAAPPGSDFGALKARLECLGGPDDYAVRVMHERVFRYMHRI